MVNFFIVFSLFSTPGGEKFQVRKMPFLALSHLIPATCDTTLNALAVTDVTKPCIILLPLSFDDGQQDLPMRQTGKVNKQL